MSAPEAQAVIAPDTRRAPLAEKQRKVWRAISASARKGISLGYLDVKFEGMIEPAPLRLALRSLTHGGYIRYEGRQVYGLYRITDRIPMGEVRPIWMDEEPDAPAPSPTLNMPTAPASVFNLGRGADGAPPEFWSDENQAQKLLDTWLPPTQSKLPTFALDSNGVLLIDMPGADVIELPQHITRALFAWLDRLGGTNLARTVEAAP